MNGRSSTTHSLVEYYMTQVRETSETKTKQTQSIDRDLRRMAKSGNIVIKNIITIYKCIKEG